MSFAKSAELRESDASRGLGVELGLEQGLLRTKDVRELVDNVTTPKQIGAAARRVESGDQVEEIDELAADEVILDSSRSHEAEGELVDGLLRGVVVCVLILQSVLR